VAKLGRSRRRSQITISAMTRSVSLLLLVTFVALCPQSVAAGWLWTSWGMTSKAFEALAVKNKMAIRWRGKFEHPNSETQWSAPYAAAGHKFTAWFVFESDRLSYVRLVESEGPECLLIETELDSTYGKPVQNDNRVPGSRGERWNDIASQNQIWFNKLGIEPSAPRWCLIDYQQL